MQDQASFRKRALLSYLSFVVPFAAAMAASIWQLTSSAADQTRRLRLEGDEISLVQRSRADAEVLVSLGRAYLITGDATLLTTLQRHDCEFDQSLVALRDGSLSPAELALLIASRATAPSGAAEGCHSSVEASASSAVCAAPDAATLGRSRRPSARLITAAPPLAARIPSFAASSSLASMKAS